MGNSGRAWFLGALFAIGTLLVVVLAVSERKGQPDRISFFPTLRLAGKATQSLNRGVTKMLPIDALDEGELGKEIDRLHAGRSVDAATEAYLQGLVAELSKTKRKPFDYHVHLVSGAPNAMAMPGGVLFVTTGLMQILTSESELIGVLGHEMGHVELSHCLDAVRFELLARKIEMTGLGEIADFANRLLIAHSYSKNQEDEADEYGYRFLELSRYNPFAMSEAFRHLQAAEGSTGLGEPSFFRDYFQSHPPVEARAEKFKSEALAWSARHAGEKRYEGKQNFSSRKTLSQQDFGASEQVSF